MPPSSFVERLRPNIISRKSQFSSEDFQFVVTPHGRSAGLAWILGPMFPANPTETRAGRTLLA